MIEIESENDGILIETRSNNTNQANPPIDSNINSFPININKLNNINNNNNNDSSTKKNSISNLIRFYETVYGSNKPSESLKTTTPITNNNNNSNSSKKLHRQYSIPAEFNTKKYSFQKHHSLDEEIRPSLIDNVNNRNFNSQNDEERKTATTSFENKRHINKCSSLINKCQTINLNLNEHDLVKQSSNSKSTTECENSTFSSFRIKKESLMDEKQQKPGKERNPSSSSSASSDTSSSAFLSPVEMRRTKSSSSSYSASTDSSENKQDEECTSSTSTSSSNIDCVEINNSKLTQSKFMGIKKSTSAVCELKQIQMSSFVESKKPVVANFFKSNQTNSDRERTVNEQNNTNNQREQNNIINTITKITSVDKNNNTYNSFNSVKNVVVVAKNNNYTRSFSNNNINFAYNSKSPNFINKVKNDKPSVNQSKSSYTLSNQNQKRFEPQQVQRKLLEWCQYHTRNYENVNITNFSSSWADGLAFCALIHSHLPDSFDFSKLMSNNRRQNFELAFDVAQEKAQIVPLLEVSDMILMGDRPDDRCIFTYVSTIYSRFNRMKMAQKQN